MLRLRVKVLAGICLMTTLAGCSVSAKYPPAPASGSFDTQSLAGRWIVTMLMNNSAPQGSIVDVALSPTGDLILSFSSPNETIQKTAVVHPAGECLIASLPIESGGWNFGLICLDQDGRRATVKAPNTAELLTRLEAGQVAGTVQEIDSGDPQIELTSSPQELGYYLMNNPDLFGTIAVLERSGEQP